MVRRSGVVVVVLAGLALAASAWAVVRPGTLGAPAGTIAPGENTTALAALRDGRILLAGQSRYGPAADTFVRAYLPGGGVDQTFGNAGEARFAGDHREVVAMAVQPDGKILVGENGAPARLHRLLPAGIADGSFGSAGRVEVDLSDSGTALSDIAAMRDGRIVTVSGAAGTTGPQHVDLRRFLADGSPDPSFGSGGRTVMTLPGLALRPAPAVQPDGSVVFVVEDGDSRVLVARLSPSGAPDPAFGAGGLSPVELPRPGLRPDVRPALGFGWDLVVLRDGRLRIPVTVGPREHVSRIGIVGLTVDGHPDPRFGARGLALGPRRHVREGGEFPQAAVRDARGSILVAGTSASGDDLSGDDAVIVRRFRRDGTLDRSFGRRGLVSDRLHGGGQPYELQLAMLDGDTAVLAEEDTIAKYSTYNGGVVRTLDDGYDLAPPAVVVTAGCRYAKVRITDISAIEEVVIRADGLVIRSAHSKRVRARLPRGARRLSVRAIDLAGNASRIRTRLPRC